MSAAAETKCECGRAVHIKKTGECSRCYLRRWRDEHPANVARHTQNQKAKR